MDKKKSQFDTQKVRFYGPTMGYQYTKGLIVSFMDSRYPKKIVKKSSTHKPTVSNVY